MEAWIVIGLLVVAVVAFATEKISVDLVTLGLLCVLVLSGILRVDQAFSGFGDRELVVVGGTLLRFTEDAEIHAVSLGHPQKNSTRSVLTNIPWPVSSLVNRVPPVPASMVQPTA